MGGIFMKENVGFGIFNDIDHLRFQLIVLVAPNVADVFR